MKNANILKSLFLQMKEKNLKFNLKKYIIDEKKTIISVKGTYLWGNTVLNGKYPNSC